MCDIGAILQGFVGNSGGKVYADTGKPVAPDQSATASAAPDSTGAAQNGGDKRRRAVGSALSSGAGGTGGTGAPSTVLASAKSSLGQ